MIQINENYRYRVQDEVAIEDFADGSLLFLCKQRKMLELNQTARRILDLMNGQRNIGQLIKIMAADFNAEEKNVRKDIQRLVDELGAQGAIKPVVKVVIKGRKKMEKSQNLMANPDASLREEDGEGAILFNADTDALLVINPIGLIIWKFLKAHPRAKSDIIDHLKEVCDAVPLDQVEADVDQFVNELHGKGFVGEVVDEKKT